MSDPRVPAGGAASVDPVTGEVWYRRPATPVEALTEAVAAARAAQAAWAAVPLRHRARALERIRQAVYARRAELADCIRRETGKPEAEALAADVLPTLDLARFFAKHAPREFGGRRLTPANPALWRKRVRIHHVPFGVVAVISPWNYPLMLPASSVLAALVAGNAVILKPSELTPRTGELLGEIIAGAGLPAGIVTVVHGDGATGAALCEQQVDKVFFTGSARAGRAVAQACARRLVPCSLELGGSDAAIVLDDADVRLAARGIAWGRFTNAGQTCAAPKRVFVDESVAEAFLEELTSAMGEIRTGNTSDPDVQMGPLIRPRQREALAAQRADSLELGGRCLTGAVPDEGVAHAVGPMAIVDAPAGARVRREETFGPLLAVVRVRGTAEAVAAANDSELGLSASVWTGDLHRGRRVAAAMDAGTVMVNDAVSVVGIAEAPHGGVKQSGFGRSHGLEGLRECVRTHTIVEDRLPGLGQSWWFGYSRDFLRDADGFTRLVHGEGLRERLGGVAGTMRLLRKAWRPR
jgi:succinate-semialdehyde dehydrogenase/glutarate-semialdehyde dehydrogenase